jgi:hypothetical protein
MAKHSKREASPGELDKEVVLIRCLLKRVPEEHRADAAVTICFKTAVWAGTTRGEMLGILELAKMAIMYLAHEVDDEVEEEESGG